MQILQIRKYTVAQIRETEEVALWCILCNGVVKLCEQLSSEMRVGWIINSISGVFKLRNLTYFFFMLALFLNIEDAIENYR